MFISVRWNFSCSRIWKPICIFNYGYCFSHKRFCIYIQQTKFNSHVFFFPFNSIFMGWALWKWILWPEADFESDRIAKQLRNRKHFLNFQEPILVPLAQLLNSPRFFFFSFCVTEMIFPMRTYKFKIFDQNETMPKFNCYAQKSVELNIYFLFKFNTSYHSILMSTLIGKSLIYCVNDTKMKLSKKKL